MSRGVGPCGIMITNAVYWHTSADRLLYKESTRHIRERRTITGTHQTWHRLTPVSTLWHIRPQAWRQQSLVAAKANTIYWGMSQYYATLCNNVSYYSAADRFAIILHVLQDTVVPGVNPAPKFSSTADSSALDASSVTCRWSARWS